MGLHLVIGNKNYSSWSMRPWIGMRATGIAFDETVISLNAPDFKPRLGKLSGTGKVPVLIDGDVHVWESLAILEYVAEKFPTAGLWPADAAARAHARAISHEMHAGFVPLRRHLPVPQHHQRRDGHHVEALLQLGGVVHVDLHQLDPPGQFGGHLLQRRADHPARPAPGRPHVDHDRDRRALRDLGKGQALGVIVAQRFAMLARPAH